jgi:hypothetical protein
VTITITDPVVVAVERGARSFDMKAKLLARGKPAKGGGVYVDVPFRHQAGSVPQAIRTAARRAARDLPSPATVRVRATTPGKVFTRSLQPGPISRALGVGVRMQEVRHRRGIHDDIVRRSTKTAAGGTRASYTTVRRISSRSPESSWHHPGFKARRALDDVLPKAKREIAEIIRDAMSSARSGR